MDERKVDWDNTIVVARHNAEGEPVGKAVSLGSMNGPRGRAVREEVLAHLKSGTTSGEVRVNDIPYGFAPKE